MSALYYLFLWTIEVLLGGLILASFTRLINTKWLKDFARGERALKFLWVIALVLFFLNYGQLPRVEGSGLRAGYFSSAMILARGVLYFLIWGGLLFWQTRTRRFGSVMLILLLVSGSLASFDWLLALTKDFESTVFGLIFLTSSTLLAYGMWLYTSRPREHLLDLNNVHLALVGVWTYVSVAQLLTIWSGNLPREVGYYLVRVHGGWRTFPEILALAQFAIPLFLLLFRKLKREPRFTRLLGLNSVLMQSVFLYWTLGPSLHPAEVVGVGEFILIGGLCFSVTRLAL